jgi:hypothetical protein
MLKFAAFAVMLAVAAVNRLFLTPRLALPSDDARQDALRALSRMDRDCPGAIDLRHGWRARCIPQFIS